MNHRIAYVLIPVSALDLDQSSHFDLFVKINNRFVKVLKKGDLPDIERINRYLEKQDDALHIESSAIEHFMDEKFATMYDTASNDESMEERVRSFLRCCELCYLDLKIVRIHPDKFMRYSMIADLGFEFFNNRFVRKKVVNFMARTIKSSITRRSILGGALALDIFLSQSEVSSRAFRSLFLGATLRDISVKLIDDHDPHSLGGAIDEAHIESYHNHPRDSVEMLRQHNLVDDMIENMITQHHEEPLGTGFPKGMKRVEIYKPAQYLQLADWIINLIEECSGPRGDMPAEEVLVRINQEIPEEQRRHLPLLNRTLVPAFGVSEDKLKALAS